MARWRVVSHSSTQAALTLSWESGGFEDPSHTRVIVLDMIASGSQVPIPSIFILFHNHAFPHNSRTECIDELLSICSVKIATECSKMMALYGA